MSVSGMLYFMQERMPMSREQPFITCFGKTIPAIILYEELVHGYTSSICCHLYLSTCLHISFPAIIIIPFEAKIVEISGLLGFTQKMILLFYWTRNSTLM